MATTSAVSWPSDEAARALQGPFGAADGAGGGSAPAPVRQRSEGRVRIAAAAFGGTTRVCDLAEAGALRVRVPRGGPGLEAVMVNVAGGVACGDRFFVEARAEAGAHLVVTTPAAEKVYRSDGPLAEIAVRLSAEAGARLEWLPQETILFDRARLARSYEIDLHPKAAFLSFEALVLGRLAHGDVMGEGLIADRWRLRRGGGLVYADGFRLSGDIGALLARPAVAGGRRALGTLLYAAPDAEGRLEEARALLAGARSDCGASAWNGLLCVRFLAPDIETLRADATSFLMSFRAAPLPRVWAT